MGSWPLERPSWPLERPSVLERPGWPFKLPDGVASADYRRDLRREGGAGAGRAMRPQKVRRVLRAIEHERCVRAFARWLGEDAQEGLRADVKRNLRGKRLLCHCAKYGLPCHAEVLAALANEPLKAERALRENA